MMKKGTIYLALLLGLASCSPSPEEVKANHAKTNKLMEQMHTALASSSVDSAKAKISAMRAINLYDDSTMAVLNGLTKQLEDAGSKSYVDDKLARLSAGGLKALKKGDNIEYFNDPTINTYFLKQLNARSSEWPRLQKEQAKAKVEEKARATAQAKNVDEGMKIIRKAYAAKLRDSFLDNNLDIDVAVSGKNATYLKLHYALFGAVWGRKFETEGMFNKFREMGFKKVELTDGYDYDYIWTL